MNTKADRPRNPATSKPLRPCYSCCRFVNVRRRQVCAECKAAGRPTATRAEWAEAWDAYHAAYGRTSE